MNSARITQLVCLLSLLGVSLLSACHVHYARGNGPRPQHVHSQTCGHHYWHDQWHASPHPYQCQDPFCDVDEAPARLDTSNAWSSATSQPPVVVTRAPVLVTSTHVHTTNCGHYYYHERWNSWPHASGCALCVTTVHYHSTGCGHYYYHGGWYSWAHSSGCWTCSPQIHVHGVGCGHFGYYSVGWGVSTHPYNCSCCRTSVSFGFNTRRRNNRLRVTIGR